MRSAQTVTGFAVMWGLACGLTEPDVITIHVRGHVLNRQDGRPVSAQVQLEHEESDGDWVWTSYRTVVDASTTSDRAGRYDLEYRTEGCRSYTLAVEADGFIPFTRERIPCIDGVQTVTVQLDPGRCIPGLFACTYSLDRDHLADSSNRRVRSERHDLMHLIDSLKHPPPDMRLNR